MAVDQEARGRISSLENQFAIFLNDTIDVPSMTNTERKTIEDALFPVINGLRTNKINGGDYTIHQVGDIIDHIDQANKRHYAGMIISLPFSGLSDINDPTKFDKYESDRLAL